MKSIPYEKSLAFYFPHLIHEWHPIKNGNLTPYDVMPYSNKKAWWKCNVAQDHEWEAVISTRTKQKCKCSCCSGQKCVLSNCLATTHPQLAKEWHPNKNGELTPYNITYGSNKKVWWNCSVAQDHEWEATPMH